MKQLLTAFFASALLTSPSAQVLYRQDFEAGFQDMLLIDNDGLTPAAPFATFTAAWNVRGDLLGNAAVSISWYDPAGRSDDWMITPVISGITGKTILEWDARAFEPSTPDSYQVLVSMGGKEIADFTDQLLLVNGEVSNGAYHHRFVLLDAYAGKNIRLAFVNISNNQYQLAVDNIVVREVEEVDAAFVQAEVAPYVRTGVANHINYSIKNNGFQTIDTLVVDWSDGSHNFSETLTGLALGFGEVYQGTFTNTFTAADPDEYLLHFNVASVGSKPDGLTANNSVTAIVAGVTAIVPRRIVGEEATGTWCGWCPRGAVYMEKMQQAYSDLFIPIAVHDGPNDPMKNTEYNDAFTIFADYPGYPSVLMDRRVLIDPLKIDSTIQELQKIVAPVAVNVQVSLDSLNHKLSIEGEITTYTTRTNAQYNLVLVVAENDVHGNGNNYRQTNYYSGGNEGVMGGYEGLPNPVPASQMRYDFVGRALLHGFHGLSGVVPATFHENDAFGFSATYVFPDTYDMDQLYVVAMVVDSSSGVVLNAAKSETLTSSVQTESKALSALKIYPNPVRGITYVEMELTESAVVTVELVNQLGQTVRRQDNGQLPAGHAILPVRVTGLPAGLYTIKMNIAGKSLLRQLVIE